jgi:hypothetical protein
MKKLLAALTLIAGVALMAIGAAQTVNAAPPQGKILICHATHNAKMPYVVISVSASANGYGHHAQHGGPLFTPGAETWGDVLPPATVDGQSYPGQNWFGQELDKRDPSTCYPAATTPPTTVPPTTVPPTTVPPTTVPQPGVKQPTVKPPTVTPHLPATGSDAPMGLLVAGGVLAATGAVVLGGAQLAGRRN